MFRKISLVLLAAALPVSLTGCSMQSTATPESEIGKQITGNIHGGQQPISSAHVYLLAASTAGYGTPSVSLLTSGTAGTDSIGGYVTTDAGGNFSITGDYSCTQNQQVYVLSLGGNPGAGVNPGAGLMAAVGACPAAGNFLGTVPYISVNEVSTVALAYSVAGFAVDPTHIASSGTALAKVGLANAFANTVNLSSGPTTPGGNGTVPLASINTLANILAACINSNGAVTTLPVPSACYTLFNDATQGSTAPTDTASAIINIAHNPTQNVADLFNLLPPGAPFQPDLTSAPADFTLVLSFTGGGLATSTAEMTTSAVVPNNIAIDANGNVWKPNYDANTLTELSPLGVPLAPNGYSGGGLSNPANVAIDLNNNVWTANVGSNTVSAFTPYGAALSGSPFGAGAINSPTDLAVDGTGNVWVVNASSLVELNSSGQNVQGSPFFSNALTFPIGIAIQPSGNIWVSDSGANNIAVYTSAGAAANGSPYAGGSQNEPYAVAFDHSNSGWITDFSAVTQLAPNGANSSGSPFSASVPTTPTGLAVDGTGNVWMSDVLNNVIMETNNAGVFLSGSMGFQQGMTTVPEAVAIDGSGNVWYSSYNDATIHEIVGAASPVVTPLAYGVKNALLGTRP